MSKALVVTAWHRLEQRDKFLAAWGIRHDDERLVLQEDIGRRGCGFTKNQGVQEAMRRGAEIVVIIDDDCFPCGDMTLDQFIAEHVEALEPQSIELIYSVTDPISRGTPHLSENRHTRVPVAASMGFWKGVPDWDAASQIVHGELREMEFKEGVVYGGYFALSGMNMALKPNDWLPWCQFIDVPRYDDIFMGWLFQKEANRRGYCFNLQGPQVWHSRQSDPWANLRAESVHMEANETLWRKIHEHPATDYATLRALLPVP